MFTVDFGVKFIEEYDDFDDEIEIIAKEAGCSVGGMGYGFGNIRDYDVDARDLEHLVKFVELLRATGIPTKGI